VSRDGLETIGDHATVIHSRIAKVAHKKVAAIVLLRAGVIGTEHNVGVTLGRGAFEDVAQHAT
jgi:hypothetical protein